MPTLTPVAIVCSVLGIALAGAQAGRTRPDAEPHATRVGRIEQDLRALDREQKEATTRQSLRARMAALRVPGISVAVFDGGQIIWSRGYGVRDGAPGARVDDTTLFQAASISKPVASVAMFRLIEQGQLSLDEDVNARLRSWKVPDSAEERRTAMTSCASWRASRKTRRNSAGLGWDVVGRSFAPRRRR